MIKDFSLLHTHHFIIPLENYHITFLMYHVAAILNLKGDLDIM